MVILTTLGRTHDITKYVEKPYQRNEGITLGAFNSGVINIATIHKNALDGIDMSRRLPLYSLVEIQTLEGLKQYYIESSVVKLLTDDNYSHKITLIELKKILEERPIPDNAITQATRGGVSYISESSRVTLDTVYGVPGGLNNPITFEVSQISNDTNVIENREIKQNGTYEISFSINFGRLNQLFPSGSVTLRADLTVGNISKSYNLGRFSSIGWVNVGTVAFNDTLDLMVGDEFDIVINSRTSHEGAWLNINSGYLTIDRRIESESREIYMDEVVDKLLSMVDVSNNPEFILDNNSRVRLANILAHDDMHTEATLYTSLERVASYVKARLYVNIVGNVKYVRFDFFDEMAMQEYIEYIDDLETINQKSNDYVSGLALQNNNVIRDNFLIEETSVRAISDNTSQITTDNTATFTRFPIDRIESFKVKGIELRDTNNNVILSANTYIDIIDNIREKAQYDTLDKYADYDNRNINNQNNHLFFIRGDRLIGGMSFIGSQFDEWLQPTTNRAIYETVATVLQRDNTSITIEKYVDKGLEGDMDLEFEITYHPMSQTHAYVYKDDQTGFQEKLIKKLNANDRVNNADYLGDYARVKVNSVGGTEKGNRHIAFGGLDILNMGSVSPSNYRLVNYTAFDYTDFIEYYPTEVKDYVFQSYYIGIDSDRRLYEIPKEEYVKRVDKSLNVIYLGKNVIPTNNSVILPKMFLKFLENPIGHPKAPKAAALTFDDKVITTLTDVGATANTIEWNFEMVDNYSAGNKRLKMPNKSAYYQYGVPYGSVLGRVDRVEVKFMQQMNADLVSKNNFPEGDLTNGVEYTKFNYPLKKDAREQYALSLQTSILSDDEDVYVYNGIGKYNLMSNNEEHEVSLAILLYRPNRDDKYVDYGRILPQENNAIVGDNYIEVDLNTSGLGYAFYERDSGELILSVSGNLAAGVHRLFYKAEPMSFKKGVVIDVNISVIANIAFRQVEHLIVNKSTNLTLDDYNAKEYSVEDYILTIGVTSNIEYRQVEHLIVDENINIRALYEASATMPINYNLNVEVAENIAYYEVPKLNVNENILMVIAYDGDYLEYSYKYRIDNGNWIPMFNEQMLLWQSQSENFINIDGIGIVYDGSSVEIRRYFEDEYLRLELRDEANVVIDTIGSVASITLVVSNGFSTVDIHGGLRIPLDVDNILVSKR